jgi:sRNA-binding regulator protein Hfq
MGHLSGFQEYLDQDYGTSVFDEACKSKKPWEFHLHGHHIIRSKILNNLVYDLKIKSDDTDKSVLSKTDVKMFYPIDISDKVRSLIKEDPKVSKLSLEPIIAPALRRHIKNKSLFPLMKERQAVFFTLLEGEIIKGLVTGFSRYEITCSLKGGLPVTILRHAVYDLRNKKGRSFLKSYQEKHKDWKKSSLYVS